MSTIQEFKCVFCNDTFENKEELQVHFRKHGDPNFGQNKVKNEASSSSDKKDDSEMVSCDVCSEVFPTIAKAITHKHKLHPDHDAKYFCPWCGKLFTLKYLLNKHLTTNHVEDKRDITIDSFPCHSCNVEFYIPSAMLYHNKFFHRQDTELPAIGYSRKLKKIKQDLLMIYYCPFCGEEHDNKINLHKHMVDDHFDENQHPEDVLRCPLCEAIFYHLDAYELHLTFHSADDLYSEKNEIVSQITEFSLEAVPPLMEKVENDIPDEVNPEAINQLLSFAMDDMADSDPERSRKKRKKHKKSKKSAITLDEFLDMNADVFGGNLDVHGIEEVPTQVINKSLKQKRKAPSMSPGSKISSADIAKLKQQGIVVKMKSNKGPVNKQNQRKVQTVAAGRVLGTTTVAKPPASDCNQVIAKLMNQSNSQIKIVKKPIQSTQVESSGNNIQPSDTTSKTSDNESEHCKNKTNSSDSQQPELDEAEPTDTLKDNIKEDEKKTSKIDNPIDALQTISKNLTIKPIPKSTVSPSNEDISDIDQSVGDIGMEDDNSKSDHSNLDSAEVPNTAKKNYSQPNNNAPMITEPAFLQSNKSLNTQKSLVTDGENAKPPCPTQHSKEVPDTRFSDESDDDLEKLVTSTSQNTRLHAEPEFKSTCNERNPLNKLGKAIVVKPCQNTSKPADADSKFIINDPKVNVSLEKKQQVPTSTSLEKENLSNISKTVLNKQENQDYTDSENEDTENTTLGKLTEFPSHLSALKKLGSHITFTSNKQNIEAKSDELVDESIKKEAPTHLDVLKKLGSGITLKSNKQKASEQENDGDHKEIRKESTNVPTKVESPKHIEALKKLGSNITFKTKPIENISSKISDYHLDDESKTDEDNLPKAHTETTKSNPLQNLQKVVKKEPIQLSTNSSQNNKIVLYNKNGTNSGNNLKNISTKSITTKNISQESNCNMVGKIVQNRSTTKEYSETEIFSVDDSDDEEFNSMPSKLIASKDKVMNVKNVNMSNPTKKNFAGPARFKNLANKIEENIANAINKANTTLENSLKKLSQHITIKSNKPDTLDDFSTADPESDWGQDSDSNDSKKGNVKISEVTEDDHADNLSDNDDDLAEAQSPLVDTPDQSDNENVAHSDEEADIESQLKTNTVKKQPPLPVNKHLNELKNLGKDICIKPIHRDQTPATSTRVQGNPQTIQQNKVSNSSQGNMTVKKCANQNKVTQKSSASNQQNTVSKEVTVKTYQTETVIEEITTTVTKTIRTVNQTMKQENSNETVQTNKTQGSSLVGIQPKMVKPRGRPPGSKNGVPNNLQVNTKMSTPTNNANTIVPFRAVRPSNPRMPKPQNNTPSSSQQAPPFTKQLRIAPNVNLRPTIKRPGPSQASVMSKKLKESSVTSSEVSTTSDRGGSLKQFSASHVSESSFTSTTQINKGNSSMSQTKSQSQSCSQQMTKLSNMSGMKITKAVQSQQSSSMEVKGAVTSSVASKSTMDAIEKLQKQGLLVKKPRLEEEHMESDFSDYDET